MEQRGKSVDSCHRVYSACCCTVYNCVLKPWHVTIHHVPWCTADAKSMSYSQCLGYQCKRDTCVIVGAPENDKCFNLLLLIMKGVKFIGSFMGRMAAIKAKLQLSPEKNVRAVIQKLSMAEVNKSLDLVRNGSVRYRVVLEN